MLAEFRNAQLQNFELQKNLLERFTVTETRNLATGGRKSGNAFGIRQRENEQSPIRSALVCLRPASKPTRALLMVNMFLFAAFGSALYFARQQDYDHIDNDLKYRYIKMKGKASIEQIEELEESLN